MRRQPPRCIRTSTPFPDTTLFRSFRVESDDYGIRLDRWFKRHLPDVGFNIGSRWARTGQLRVDGARATPGDRVAEGQVIRVPPEVKAAAPVKREIGRAHV